MLANREHDVTLACRDPEQARAIAETGRNPRYLTHCDLRGVAATTIEEAPIEDAELSSSPFRAPSTATSSRRSPGDAPILSLTKGLDPATGSGCRRSCVGRPGGGPVAARTSRTRSLATSRPLP